MASQKSILLKEAGKEHNVFAAWDMGIWQGIVLRLKEPFLKEAERESQLVKVARSKAGAKARTVTVITAVRMATCRKTVGQPKELKGSPRDTGLKDMDRTHGEKG